VNKLITSIALGALILFLLTAKASAVNLLVNGNFEGGTYVEYGDTLPDGWSLYPVDDQSLSNCGVSSATNAAIDLGPQSGTNYMSFQARETDGSQDCLFQNLATVVGQKYLITFYVAITSGTIGPDAYLDPEWDAGGTDDTFLRNSDYYFPSSTVGPVPYEMFSFTEEASQTTTTFFFHGVDAYGGSILVDNVSVSAVPEPSTWAMLAMGIVGIGMLCGVARRRRRWMSI
jgi:hypothetical protein